MRYGLCTGDLSKIERLDQLGYDYADIGASTLLPFAPESQFAPIRERLRSAPVRAEALGGFLPGNVKVVGPGVDWPKVRDYLEVTLGRAAEVGVEVVNWGSAESRMVPADSPTREPSSSSSGSARWPTRSPSATGRRS